MKNRGRNCLRTHFRDKIGHLYTNINRLTEFFSDLSGSAYYVRLVNPTTTLEYDEICENGYEATV